MTSHRSHSMKYLFPSLQVKNYLYITFSLKYFSLCYASLIWLLVGSLIVLGMINTIDFCFLFFFFFVTRTKTLQRDFLFDIFCFVFDQSLRKQALKSQFNLYNCKLTSYQNKWWEDLFCPIWYGTLLNINSTELL